MAIKRQTAYKVSISELNSGEYIKSAGEWESNYLKIRDKEVSRINIIGAVVDLFKNEDESYFTALIDDGTGNIRIRGWKEESEIFKNISVGDFILLIGRIKDYTGSIYITPEIVKKLDNKLWLEIRKIELKENFSLTTGDNITKGSILDKLKELDSPNGVEISELSRETRMAEEEIEKEVEILIKGGEVYQIKPGFLKLI